MGSFAEYFESAGEGKSECGDQSNAMYGVAKKDEAASTPELSVFDIVFQPTKWSYMWTSTHKKQNTVLPQHKFHMTVSDKKTNTLIATAASEPFSIVCARRTDKRSDGQIFSTLTNNVVVLETPSVEKGKRSKASSADAGAGAKSGSGPAEARSSPTKKRQCRSHQGKSKGRDDNDDDDDDDDDDDEEEDEEEQEQVGGGGRGSGRGRGSQRVAKKSRTTTVPRISAIVSPNGVHNGSSSSSRAKGRPRANSSELARLDPRLPRLGANADPGVGRSFDEEEDGDDDEDADPLLSPRFSWAESAFWKSVPEINSCADGSGGGEGAGAVGVKTTGLRSNRKLTAASSSSSSTPVLGLHSSLEEPCGLDELLRLDVQMRRVEEQLNVVRAARYLEQTRVTHTQFSLSLDSTLFPPTDVSSSCSSSGSHDTAAERSFDGGAHRDLLATIESGQGANPGSSGFGLYGCDLGLLSEERAFARQASLVTPPPSRHGGGGVVEVGVGGGVEAPIKGGEHDRAGLAAHYSSGVYIDAVVGDGHDSSLMWLDQEDPFGLWVGL